MNQRPLYNVVDGYGRTVNLRPLHNYWDAERLSYEQYKRTFATLMAVLPSRYSTAGYESAPCHAHTLAKCNVVRVEVK